MIDWRKLTAVHRSTAITRRNWTDRQRNPLIAKLSHPIAGLGFTDDSTCFQCVKRKPVHPDGNPDWIQPKSQVWIWLDTVAGTYDPRIAKLLSGSTFRLFTRVWRWGFWVVCFHPSLLPLAVCFQASSFIKKQPN